MPQHPMKLGTLVLVVALLASACSTSNDGEWHPLNPGAAFPTRDCPPDGPNSFYFPTGVFEDGFAGDAFDRQWYSASLTAMSEPSLSCGSPSAEETYRFLWLRSFHQPIAVRIARAGDHYELNAVVLSGARGYEPGRVVRRVHRSLTHTQWDQAIQALEQVDFWSLSSKPKPDENNITVDGAQWIIEGRNESYHVVDRWGGEDGVRYVGLTFLALSGISIRSDLTY